MLRQSYFFFYIISSLLHDYDLLTYKPYFNLSLKKISKFIKKQKKAKKFDELFKIYNHYSKKIIKLRVKQGDMVTNGKPTKKIDAQIERV